MARGDAGKRRQRRANAANQKAQAKIQATNAGTLDTPKATRETLNRQRAQTASLSKVDAADAAVSNPNGEVLVFSERAAPKVYETLTAPDPEQKITEFVEKRKERGDYYDHIAQHADPLSLEEEEVLRKKLDEDWKDILALDALDANQAWQMVNSFMRGMSEVLQDTPGEIHHMNPVLKMCVNVERCMRIYYPFYIHPTWAHIVPAATYLIFAYAYSFPKESECRKSPTVLALFTWYSLNRLCPFETIRGWPSKEYFAEAERMAETEEDKHEARKGLLEEIRKVECKLFDLWNIVLVLTNVILRREMQMEEDFTIIEHTNSEHRTQFRSLVDSVEYRHMDPRGESPPPDTEPTSICWDSDLYAEAKADAKAEAKVEEEAEEEKV